MRVLVVLCLLLSACAATELTEQQDCEQRGGVYHEEREECFGVTTSEPDASATPDQEKIACEADGGIWSGLNRRCTPSPSLRATPRVTPTPRPTPVPTPEAEGELVKTQEVVIAWQNEFSDYVSYQVLVEVQNVGTGWAQQNAYDADYTILGPDGGVVATGRFTYAFPEYIPPGGFGYMVDDGSDIGGGSLSVDDFATVEVDGQYLTVDSPGPTLEVTDIALKPESFGGGLTATGFVTASEDVADAALAVICFAADGNAIGASWTNLLQNLTGGQPKGFETVRGTPPMTTAECATVEGFASDTGF